MRCCSPFGAARKDAMARRLATPIPRAQVWPSRTLPSSMARGLVSARRGVPACNTRCVVDEVACDCSGGERLSCAKAGAQLNSAATERRYRGRFIVADPPGPRVYDRLRGGSNCLHTSSALAPCYDRCVRRIRRRKHSETPVVSRVARHLLETLGGIVALGMMPSAGFPQSPARPRSGGCR